MKFRRLLTIRTTIVAAAAIAVWTFGAWDATRPAVAVRHRVASGPVRVVTGPEQSLLEDSGRTSRDWPYATHDYSGSRFSPLHEITATNVRSLRLKCTYDVGDAPSFQANPVVYAGRIYVTTVTLTASVDASTCREVWRYERAPRARPIWPNNRGAAIKDGLVVRATADGFLIALDASTGAPRWERRVANTAAGELFTMPPLIYRDKIIIGPAGSENLILGWVGAFRLSDGAPLWRFSTIPAANSPEGDTWLVPDTADAGGGAIWTPVTLDAAAGILYVPTANPAPDHIAEVREGANLFTNSVVALEIETGRLAWYRQLVPGDTHDWDLTHAGPLYEVDGRHLIATIGKDGVLRVINRSDHSIVSETVVSRQLNTLAPITRSGTYVCPGKFGGVEWNGPAFSPTTGFLYIPSVEYCGTYIRARTARRRPGTGFDGGVFSADELTRSGFVTAVDGRTGEIRWRYKSSYPVLGATIATAGGVVFAGELDGHLIALDATSGTVLSRVQTGGGIGGGIVTYAVAGKQYVAVASGRPTVTMPSPLNGRARLLIFALAPEP